RPSQLSIHSGAGAAGGGGCLLCSARTHLALAGPSQDGVCGFVGCGLDYAIRLPGPHPQLPVGSLEARILTTESQRTQRKFLLGFLLSKQENNEENNKKI